MDDDVLVVVVLSSRQTLRYRSDSRRHSLAIEKISMSSQATFPALYPFPCPYIQEFQHKSSMAPTKNSISI